MPFSRSISSSVVMRSKLMKPFSLKNATCWSVTAISKSCVWFMESSFRRLDSYILRPASGISHRFSAGVLNRLVFGPGHKDLGVAHHLPAALFQPRVGDLIQLVITGMVRFLVWVVARSVVTADQRPAW